MSKEFKPGRGYKKADWDAVDSPELTDEQFAAAKPFADALFQLAAAIRKRGPAKTKEAALIRLDFDIIEKLRASGPGWQSRANDLLRKSLGL